MFYIFSTRFQCKCYIFTTRFECNFSFFPLVSSVNFQVNHFPGSHEMTRKDRLWANYVIMRRHFGPSVYDYLPETYVLPEQAEQFFEVDLLHSFGV
jgi:hypothetical protein